MADTAEHARTSHLRFALAVHAEVARGGGNSCFSPYSAASALGLVAKASRGQTAEELTELLGGDPGELLRVAASIQAPDNQPAPVLAVSNTLWAWDELPLREEFRRELGDWPNGSVASAPFVDDPEKARQLINADIADTTHELIPELLLPGSVGPDTVASVVNALYLRTSWLNQFYEDGTEPAPFHAPGGTAQVPTMRLSERLGYAAAEGWQVVSLPAVGEVEAVVLMPDGALADAEAALDHSRLAALLDAREDQRVELALPRFALDVRSDLAAALRALGVRTMFTPDADLGGLSPDPRLVVSDVLHQAVLRIDEKGLEGAAATAAMIRMVSMDLSEPVPVQVDRPFLLLVRHVGSGAVYFLARVTNP